MLEVISYLKRKRKDYLSILNLLNNKGWNCLFETIDSTENGLPEIVEVLIKNGIEINYKDPKGITALHLSAYKGQDDNVDLLIKHKSDINALDNLGRSPIFLAVMEGQTNAIQALLDSNADINILDNNGDSLIHYSFFSKGNNLLYTIMLHEKGMNINKTDKDGNTILLLSAKNGIKNNYRLIRKIIDIGGDLFLKNNKKESFYDYLYSEAMKDKKFIKEYQLDLNKNKNSTFSINQKDNKNLIIGICLLLFSFLLRVLIK